MYELFLLLHSWNRWLVLISGAIAVLMALTGWLSKNPFKKSSNIAGGSYVGFLHLQLVLGLTLYIFLSPFTQAAFRNTSMLMKTKELRYWSVEHITGMIIAIAVAQAGRGLSKRATADREKHKKSLLFYGLSLFIILLTVYFAHRPWWRF